MVLQISANKRVDFFILNNNLKMEKQFFKYDVFFQGLKLQLPK